jgi:hypothetical protein
MQVVEVIPPSVVVVVPIQSQLPGLRREERSVGAYLKVFVRKIQENLVYGKQMLIGCPWGNQLVEWTVGLLFRGIHLYANPSDKNLRIF